MNCKIAIFSCTQVRDFMLQRVYMLKRPKTNVQIVQQSSLLKYKYFLKFLKQHGPDVYAEIRSEYMSVMSKILASHFRSYLSSMEKLVVVVAHQVGAQWCGLGVGAGAEIGSCSLRGACTHLLA